MVDLASTEASARTVLISRADTYFWWLIGSTIVLFVGAIGEYFNPFEWLKNSNAHIGRNVRASRRWSRSIIVSERLAIAMVVGGIGGEGIFEYLAAHTESAVREFDRRATEQAQQKASDRLDLSTKNFDVARSALESEITLATGKVENVRAQAARLSADLKVADERLAGIHAYLTPRSLTQNEMDDLRDALKPLADPTTPIVVIWSFESGLGVQVWRSLTDAGFSQATLGQPVAILASGMSISTPLKYGNLAGRIGGILLERRIGPMVGVLGITPDSNPIRIVIGDIRTGPLPSTKTATNTK